MKDRDRFNSKSNYIRKQKYEKGLWKTFKNNYKEKTDTPIILNYKQNIYKGPNDISETFNTAFIDKIADLKNKIPQGEDPLIHYKKLSIQVWNLILKMFLISNK